MNFKHYFFLFFVILFFTAPNFASAQEDVCCLLAKKSGEAVETLSTVRSSNDCVAGKTSEDNYQICAAKQDPSNDCPNFGEKERCETCGYHWSGKSCMSEDPVKKAKTLLEEEAKKKQKVKAVEPLPDSSSKAKTPPKPNKK